MDGQLAAAFPHGMKGIGAEIHHDLMNLGGVGPDDARLAGELLAHADGCREGGAQQFDHLLDDQYNIQWLLFGVVSTAECQNLTDQFLGAKRRIEHSLKAGIPFLARSAVVHEYLRVAQDRREDIIEMALFQSGWVMG